MMLVSEIFEEAKGIFGHCNNEKLFRWISDAVELLANKGEVDPLVGYVDICADGKCITLPREVETVLAVNLGGRPALGHDALFTFHLNGPGDFKTNCSYTWDDKGNWPTFKELKCPSKLVAFLESEDDEGTQLRVFGYDKDGCPLRMQIDGKWVDGYLVPTIFGFALPDAGAPDIARVTAVVKDPTVGCVRLSSFDNSSTTGTLIGVYEPDETRPLYRRIRVHRGLPWVRIAYRKRTIAVTSIHDRILLHSRPALILALHALKFYRDKDIANGAQFEAHAVRLLTEKESMLVSPGAIAPIMVEDRNAIMDHSDWNVE